MSNKPLTRKIIQCLTLLSVVFFISSCSEPSKEIIRFGVSSAPLNLDPRYATDAVSSRINRLIYQRLVDFEEAYTPAPSLADWRVVSPKHYRLRLINSDARFHTGESLTTEDVKATYDYILDAKHGSPHRTTLNLIQSIVVIDKNTIDFYLKKPDPLFPSYLVIGILQAKLIEKEHPFNNRPVGSGGFKFQNWEVENRLQLKRIADDQLFEFVAISQPTVRVLKLLRGEIDITQNELPAELIKYVERRHDMVLQHHPGSTFTYLGFNSQDKVVGQHKLRLAIAHGINRKEIIHYLFADSARLTSSILAPEHWAGSSSKIEYLYNPDKAKALMAELGFSVGHPVTINYKTSSDPFRIRLATIFQSQLAKIGIQLRIHSYDWGTFYGDIKSGNFQMYSLSWVGIKTPDIFRYVFHSQSIPPNGANRGRYANAKVDEFIEKAQFEPSRQLQSKYYQELQHVLFKTLPYVPLWFEGHVYISSRNIKGYKLNLLGNYDGLKSITKE